MTTAVQNKVAIFETLASHQQQISKFGVRKLGLFGSFARGQQNKASDIDMLVEFTPGRKSYDNFIHLVFFLEDLLQHSVELVTPESLSPLLKPYIEKEVEYVVFTD